MSTPVTLCGQLQTLTLDQLRPWEDNPRGKVRREHINRLKASMRAGGLLQNFVAVPDGQGKFWVIAGNSRLIAAQELVEAGEVPADAAVICDVREIDIADAEALKLALTENTIRQQMEPIDEAAAMAELARRGERTASIAVAFGLSENVVKQRLALGRLVPEAQELIRERARDLDWGKALSMADAPTQSKICSDIALNPAAWRDGQEIRRFLTADTIPASHALFDTGRYTGRIVRDFFEGDKLADRDEFWTLQNEAIDALRAELESEGYKEVVRSDQPVDHWLYDDCEDPAQSIAIVEVAPNGRVNVHKGKVPKNDAPVVEDSEAEHEAEVGSEIAPDGVRVTPAVAEYMAAHRSAMLQANLSDDFRSCLEIAVAGLIGHGDLAIRAMEYRFPGGNALRTGPAFEQVGADKDAVQETLRDGGVGQGGQRDHEIVAMLAAMDDEQLSQLFTRLVAGKVGQTATRGLDSDPESLTNAFGQRLQIDIRAHWTPDSAFFDLMSGPDLRRLAEALLPADRRRGVATAKRRHVVQLLADSFAAAAARDGSLDPADAKRLNAWVPGGMAFPAHDDLVQDGGDTGEEAEAAHDALFSGASADPEQNAA
jgi:ParB family chromosome partitioning protein